MKPRRNDAGFSLVGATFILVVLSLVSAAMMNMASLNLNASTQSLRSIKAYAAARAGLEWALHKTINGDLVCDGGGSDVDGEQIDFSDNANGISEASARIECAAFNSDEEAIPGSAFSAQTLRIRSTGFIGNPNDIDYVERQLEAIVRP